MSLPLARSSLTIAATVRLLPVPGPPVSRLTPDPSTWATAACWALSSPLATVRTDAGSAIRSAVADSRAMASATSSSAMPYRARESDRSAGSGSDSGSSGSGGSCSSTSPDSTAATIAAAGSAMPSACSAETTRSAGSTVCPSRVAVRRVRATIARPRRPSCRSAPLRIAIASRSASPRSPPPSRLGPSLGVAEGRRGHVLERGADGGGQADGLGVQAGLQLLRGAGADDRRDHARPVAHPGEGDGERRGPEPLGGGDHGLHDPVGLGRAQPVDEALPLGGGAAGLRRRAVPVLAGQQPATERRPGQDAEPHRLRGGHHLPLDAALEERVLDLGADDRRPAGPRALPGRRLRGLPAGEVADADVARPPGADRLVARGEGLLERRRLVPGVQLPEVDVVEAQALEGGVERRQQVPTPRAAAHRSGRRPADGLGRDQHVGARDDVGEQVPEGALALAVAVHVGGVDQRAAGVDEGGELHGGLVLVGVPAPRHRAQRQPGHDQTTPPQRALLHEGPTYRRTPPGTGEHPGARSGAAGRRPGPPRVSGRACPTRVPTCPHRPGGGALMGWVEAVVLGIVQGLTEFLPISSSAHLRLVGELFGWDDPGAAFTAIIQIGTEAAVLLYFRKDIWRIVVAWLGSLAGGRKGDPDARMGWLIIVGSIPIVVLGLLFQDDIETTLRDLRIVAICLVAFSLILFWADRVGAKTRELKDLTVPHGIGFGFAQAMALIPGVSRSGGTITAGLFLGYSRAAAARYSFLLAIPAVLGSGFFQAYEALTGDVAGQGVSWGPTILATVIGFGVGLTVIAWLLRYLDRGSFTPFVVYRVVLGLLVLGLVGAGVLSPT